MTAMVCVLCRTAVSLLDLDAEGYEGLPAHTYCAEPHRQLIRETLAEAEAMILAEPDPRRHRKGVRPAAA